MLICRRQISSGGVAARDARSESKGDGDNLGKKKVGSGKKLNLLTQIMKLKASGPFQGQGDNPSGEPNFACEGKRLCTSFNFFKKINTNCQKGLYISKKT